VDSEDDSSEAGWSDIWDCDCDLNCVCVVVAAAGVVVGVVVTAVAWVAPPLSRPNHAEMLVSEMPDMSPKLSGWPV